MSNLDTAFWEERYKLGELRWDIGEVAPPFVDYLESADAPTPAKIIIPGSGRGHDALYFADKGFNVLGLDIAPSAIAYGRAQATARNLSDKLQFEQLNFLTEATQLEAQFDYAAEHTCFCAIDPALRPDYVQAMHTVLKPDGLLIAIFFAHNRAGGPPFRTDADEIHRLFAPYFKIERLEPATRSHPSRKGEELFGLLRK